MPRQKSTPPVSEIRIQQGKPSLRAVYMVEVLDSVQSQGLSRYLEELSPSVSAVQLSDGKLVSYALQLDPGSEELLLEIERTLKERFGFVMSGSSFTRMVYDTVSGLCRDSQSLLLPVHECSVCQTALPFPDASVTWLDSRKKPLSPRLNCCGECASDFIDRDDGGLATMLSQLRLTSHHIPLDTVTANYPIDLM